MLDVYHNYSAAVKAAGRAALRVGETFTWDKVALNYISAIGMENLVLPDVEERKWIQPPVRRYLVRVNRTHPLEVAGVQYVFEPGRDYWEPADVKRILYDANLLDPACLPQNMLAADPDQDGNPFPMDMLETGLTEAQLAGQTDYTAANSICPTCHQRLNTNVPTLEELEALAMPRET